MAKKAKASPEAAAEPEVAVAAAEMVACPWCGHDAEPGMCPSCGHHTDGTLDGAEAPAEE
jgi:rubrerythrin